MPQLRETGRFQNVKCAIYAFRFVINTAWKTKHQEILDALKRGKEVVDIEVENALLETAKGGNVVAMIFWLKNRRPDRWKDKPATDADVAALEKLDAILREIGHAEPVAAEGT